MDFTLTSSIDELLRTGIIKKRTYNICKTLGISTVGQIISTPLYSFSKATGAGKKTVWEISRVKDMFGIRNNGEDESRSGESRGSARTVRRHKGSSGAPSLFKEGEVRSQLSFMLNTEAKTLLDRTPDLTEEDLTACFGPNLRMVESLIKMPRELFRFVDTGDVEKDKRLHKFLGSLFQKALLVSSRHSPHYAVVAKAREYYRSHQKEHEMLSSVGRLTREQQEFLLSSFRQQCEDLSVRAKNGFRAVDSVEMLVGLLYSPTFFTDNRLPNCGSTVQEEWNMRNGQFVRNFENNLEIFVTGDAEAAETHLRGVEVRSVFPFLDNEEMHFVLDQYSRNGRYPGVWLLLHYIRRTAHSDNQAKAYCMVYGLGEEGRRMDIKTLAASLGMSDQNVRNYLATELRCPKGLADAAAVDLIHLRGDVISELDGGWEQVNISNSLSLNPLQLMGLFSATRAGYKIDCVAGKYYLIKRELLRKVKLQVCFSKLQAVIKRRRKAAEEVDLYAILRDGLPESEFHPSYIALADIYSEALADNEYVEDMGDGRLRLLPNSIDRMKAFEEILEEAGRPMHFDEIIEAFCRRYPHENNIKNSTVRSFLHRSELIKSRGKSGSYVHASDSGIYTGTITELLHTRLREAGRPLTLTELAERVRGEFPDTTRSSINSLMLLDARKRFLLLADDKCALAGEDYGDEELCERPSRMRRTLLDRMDEFMRFLEENGRFPFFTAEDKEKALRRWMENVLAGRIADSDAERARLETIVAENQGKMPMSARDEAFRDMCLRIEEIAEETGALPTSRQMREYQWLRKHSRGMVELSGFQQVCYDRLRDSLRKHNIVI